MNCNKNRRFLIKSIITLSATNIFLGKVCFSSPVYPNIDEVMSSNTSDYEKFFGRRSFTHEDNIMLLKEFAEINNIKLADFDYNTFRQVNSFPRVDLSINGVIDNGTALLQSKILEAEKVGAALFIHGGGVIYVNDEINVSVNIEGDGITRIIQSSKFCSLLVLVKRDISLQNLVLTPSSFNRSINQAAIEIRSVSYCRILNTTILYNGSHTEEGNGIAINEGDYNVIINCKLTGANLNDGTYHHLGGNDISVYGNSSFNLVAFNSSNGRNIRGIYQLNDVLGKKCNHNIYLCNSSNGNIGYGHICYEKKHDNNTSMSNTMFLRGIVKNISGSATIPTGKYANRKVFGMGVYNQGGQGTVISDYLIENVLLDPDIQLLLPTGAIGSTGGNVKVIRNTILNSGKSGVKISNIYKDKNLIALVSGNLIKNCLEEAVYLIHCNNIFITGLYLSDCKGLIKAVDDGSVRKFASKLSVTDLYSNNSQGGFVNGFDTVSFKNCNSYKDTNVLHIMNVKVLKVDKFNIYNARGFSLYFDDSCESGHVSNVKIIESENDYSITNKINVGHTQFINFNRVKLR